MLENWKYNILNFEAEINIELIENKKIVIKHRVLTNGFGCTKPIAFSTSFKKNLLNLKEYINSYKKYEGKNNLILKSGKLKILTYIGLVIIRTDSEIYFGSILQHLTRSTIFGYLGIIIGAIGNEKIMNRYFIKKTPKGSHLIKY